MDTTFTSGTVITSDWLNDINDFVYTTMAGFTLTSNESTYPHIDAAGAWEFLDASAVLADLLTGGSLLADQIILGYDSELAITVNGTSYVHEFAVYDDETADNQEFVVVHTNDVAGDAGVMTFARGHGVIGTPTVVSDNDVLGQIKAVGFDGTDFAESSMIQFEVDGTPTSDQMGGAIVFLTSPDGSQTVAEVLRLANNKLATFASSVTLTTGDLTLTTGGITLSADGGDITFNKGGQGSNGSEQTIFARDSGGGGGALEKVMIPRRVNNDRLALFGGGGGFEIKSSDDVTYWLAITGTGASTWKNAVTHTIPVVDIGGGFIDATDIGQSQVATASFDDVSIEASDSPTLTYYDSGGAANEKYWFTRMDSAGSFIISLDNDALGAEAAAMTVERSGATLGDTTFGSPTLIATDLTMDSGAGGSGSVFGGATGGAQGAGTINAKGFYVDGTVISSPATKVKSADESETGTTLQNDDHLASFSLTTGKRYAVVGHFAVSCPGSDGWKGCLTFSQTPQYIKIQYDDANLGTAGVQTASGSAVPFAGAPTSIKVLGQFLANASSGGTVTLQFASNAGGSGATMKDGSWLQLILLD